MTDWLRILLGLATLIVGAEALVRGSSALALRFGVSRLVVGLTVVAFGTSAPELAVSVRAALIGQGDIAVGNVIGSNIANILLILGIAALVQPLDVHRKVVRIDIPIMIGVTVVALAVLADGQVGRIEGLALFAGIVAYTWLSVVLERREGNAGEPPPALRGALALSLLGIVGGLAALAFGADRFVAGAVGVAGAFGVSEALIGLTIVAVGTSLPEMATSIMAAVRGESDLAVGNVVGSNIFNILGIMGASATVRPLALSGIGWVDIGVMLAAAVLLLPLAHSGTKLVRLEAVFFLALYATFVGLRATVLAG